MPSTGSARIDDSRRVILSGKDLQDWFKFDRQTLRWCRRRYGDELGPRLWNDDFRVIDEQSVTAIAQDVYDNMLRLEGYREASSYYDWDWFWSVDYQRAERSRMVSKLYDYVEEHCDGKALKYVSELKSEERGQIRGLLSKKFGGATKAQVTALESDYEAGLPDSNGNAFPIGAADA